MGRKPEGDRAWSGAERQARYRERSNQTAPVPGATAAAAGAGRVTKPRRLTRPERWHAAVGVVVALQAEYAAWYEALPEATRDGATGDALRAI